MLTIQCTILLLAGLLAFRECDPLLKLLNRAPIRPQVLFVDGFGELHPQGCGLASHLGVVADIPTIGIGKSLLHIDGLSTDMVRSKAAKHTELNEVPLVGDSGKLYGKVIG